MIPLANDSALFIHSTLCTSSLVFIPTLEDELLLVSSPRLRTSSQRYITNISGPTSDGSSTETFIEGLLYAKYYALSVSMCVHACATTLGRRSYNSLQRCKHLTQGPRAPGKKLLPAMVSNSTAPARELSKKETAVCSEDILDPGTSCP